MNLYEEVMKLKSEGMKNRQIAKLLDISVGGVSNITKGKYNKNKIQKSIHEAREQVPEYLQQLQDVVEKLKEKGYNVNVEIPEKEKHISKAMKPFLGGNPNNVLVISDIHEPYSLEGYLQFCRTQQENFNCGTVVYIGDIVDFHSISYHEKIPEQLNPSGEMAKARIKMKDWYSTFPQATVLMGNHDLLVYRQARTAGLLREFIKDPNSIFEAPDTYKFVDELIIDNVLYTHGSDSNAFKKCILENMNMVSGHAHTQCGVMYHQNRHGQLFGMQVGVGIDYKSQSFDYAKSSSKHPVLACGVVLDSGRLPIVLPFTSSK